MSERPTGLVLHGATWEQLSPAEQQLVRDLGAKLQAERGTAKLSSWLVEVVETRQSQARQFIVVKALPETKAP